MEQITIDKFKERFGQLLTETGHPNKMILGERHSHATSIKWCNACRCMWPGEYKVDNDLWKRVVPEAKLYLCLPCLDQRVLEHRGYNLDVNDFPEAPMNRVLHWAYQRGHDDA